MIPSVNGTALAGDPGLPLLVCGPSLGTSARALWSRTAALLADRFHVVGWDLPGHGDNRDPVTHGYTMAELAEGVLSFVDRVLADRGAAGEPVRYTGVSIGGAVGQRLLLDHPDRIHTATLVCTSPRFGDEAMWRERAAQVRVDGMAAQVDGARERWFRPGFADADPDGAEALLDALRHTDPAGYAAGCEALATFDVRADLPRIDTPVTVLAGAYDPAAPVAAAARLAHGVRHGRLVVLERAAHQAPVEAPADTARVLLETADPGAPPDRRASGEAVRRAVLGDEHVDRSHAAATDLTRDFQEFITEYAWGGVWTRPGLDRRSRSMITLAVLVALGHHDELALHLRGARTNGLTDDEIRELLLHTAIYCGVPAANTAFRIASQTLGD